MFVSALFFRAGQQHDGAVFDVVRDLFRHYTTSFGLKPAGFFCGGFASVFLACIPSVSLDCIFQADKAKPKRTENDLFLCLISGVCFWDNFSVV